MTSRQDEGRRALRGMVPSGEGTITGTVVCAAVIAYAGNDATSVARLTLAILGTTAVYWLAHLHAITIGSALTYQQHPFVALRHALRATWPIAGAAVVPVGVLLVTSLFGAELQAAAWASLIVTIALLTAYSYAAGARGGLNLRDRIACAVAGASLGVLVALLKVALH